jgi:DNA polymerase-1
VPAYTRTVLGDEVTIHAPRPGESLDGFATFAESTDLFGLDVETTATMTDARMFGEGFGVRLVQFGTETEAWVLDPTVPEQHDLITGLLTDESKHFVSHTTYDPLCVWAGFSIPLGVRAVDTHILASLIEPGKRSDKSLKTLTENYIDNGLRHAEDALHTHFAAIIPPGSGIRRGTQAMIANGFDTVAVDAQPFVVYAGLDAIYVRRLFPLLLDECKDFPDLVRMEFWLAAQTVAITIRGLPMDMEQVRRGFEEVGGEVKAARDRIEALTGFAALSPKRIGWLQERGVEFESFTDKGNPSMDKDALPLLLAKYGDVPEVGQMLEDTYTLSQRSNLKANLGSFLKSADADGRVHPDIKTLQAHTGRMSVTNPALQTLKKSDPRLRSCFIADEGMALISCDFTNVEIRVAAALAQEPSLIRAIKDGEDIHSNTAALMFGPGFQPEQRALGKMATFLTTYGGGVRALMEQARIPEATAVDVITKFKAAYPKVRDYGYAMGNITDVVVNDAQRHIPVDPNRTYANSNYMIQSLARDLLVEAAYRFVMEKGYADALYLLIHDELVVQVPIEQAERAAADLRDAMTTTYRGVPIEADVEVLGARWGHNEEEQVAA